MMKLFTKLVAAVLVTTAFSGINMAMDFDDPNTTADDNGKLSIARPPVKTVASEIHEYESDHEHEGHKGEEAHSDHEGHGNHLNGILHDEKCEIIHARKPLVSTTTSQGDNHTVFCLPCGDPGWIYEAVSCAECHKYTG